MSIFLAMLPRGKSHDASGEVTWGFHETVNCLSGWIGPKYAKPAQIIEPATVSGGAVACWDAPNEIHSGISIRKGVWVTSTMPAVSRKIRDSIRSEIGHLSYAEDVEGPFAAIWGNKGSDRVLAWSSPPAIEPVFYSTTDQHVILSNRLILTAAAANDELRELEMDEQFMLEYLSFGYSISEKTPFSGVSMLMPRKCLSIWNGELSIVDAPEITKPEFQTNKEPRLIGSKELVQSLRHSTQFLVSSLPEAPVQLRLSGGKDSRLMLGLLREVPDLRITAVTQGDENSEQVKVAAELAELANVDFIATAPNMTVPTSIISSCERTIFESGGLLPSEPTIAPFSAADPLSKGEYLAAGEWPLFKGFLERTSNQSLEAVNGLLGKLPFNDFLNHTAEERVAASYDKWKSSIPTLTSYDLLYMYGRDIRAARYQHAKTSQIDFRSTIFYPFLDPKVVAISDAISRNNRLNQFTMFSALKEIWPESFEVPFADHRLFKFEYRSSLAEFSSGFQKAWNRSPRTYQGRVTQYSQRPNAYDSVFYSAPISSAANFVVTSGYWDYLKGFLDRAFVALAENWAKESNDLELKQAGDTPKQTKTSKIKLWRLLLIVLWMNKRWLTPPE